MKTKIKRHYRSVLSVVLAITMLISCMTVGLIATDAAKTTDERLGDNEINVSYLLVDVSAYSKDLKSITGAWDTTFSNTNGCGSINITSNHFCQRIEEDKYLFNLRGISESRTYLRAIKLTYSDDTTKIVAVGSGGTNKLTIDASNNSSWGSVSTPMYFVEGRFRITVDDTDINTYPTGNWGTDSLSIYLAPTATSNEYTVNTGRTLAECSAKIAGDGDDDYDQWFYIRDVINNKWYYYDNQTATALDADNVSKQLSEKTSENDSINAKIKFDSDSEAGPVILKFNSNTKYVSYGFLNYDITFTDDGHGSASCSSPYTSITGTNTLNISATPNEHYVFDEWEVTSGSASFGNAKSASTTATVTAAATIRAKFKEATHSVSFSVDVPAGGSITPNVNTNVGELTKTNVSATANDHYYVSGFTPGNGITLTDEAVSGNNRTAKIVTKATGTYTVTANVSPVTYTGITSSSSYSTSPDAKTDNNTYDGHFNNAPTLTVPTSGTYVNGISISAPDDVTGYTFYKWVATNGTFTQGSEDTEDSNANSTFYPTANGASLQALYRKEYTINATVDPSSYGEDNAVAITTPASGAKVSAGDTYVIAMTPASGAMVSAATLNQSPVTVTNDVYTGTASGSSATLNFTATFAQAISVTATKAGDGNGTVQINSRTAQAASDTTNVPAGSQVTFTAVASENYTFCGWYSDSSCTTLVSYNPEYVVPAIESTKSLYANFAPANFYLNGYLKSRNWTNSNYIKRGDTQTQIKDNIQFTQDEVNKNIFTLSIDMPGDQYAAINTGALDTMYLPDVTSIPSGANGATSGTAAAVGCPYAFYEDVTTSPKWYVPETSESTYPLSDTITFTWDAVARTLSWTREPAEGHSYIYVKLTEGTLYAHIWSANHANLFGSWPGTDLTSFPEVTINKETYRVIDISSVDIGPDEAFKAKINTGSDDNSAAEYNIDLGDSYIIYYGDSELHDASSLYYYDVTASARKKTFNPTTGTLNEASDADETIGTASTSVHQVKIGHTVDLTAVHTDTAGYHFAGWFKSAACTGAALDDNLQYTATPEAKTDYYALFTQKAPASYTYTTEQEGLPSNTATFSQTGVAAAGNTQIYKGATVTVTTDPHNSSYKVGAWYVNGVLQEGKKGYTLTIPNVTSNITVKAVFVEKTTEKITIGINDTDLGTAQAKNSDDAAITTALEGTTVKIVATSIGEGMFVSLAVTDTVTNEEVSTTEVTKTADAATYTFTMPENEVYVQVNFDYYLGNANYWFDGRNSDKTVKSEYDTIRMSEGKYNGQKYAYYKLTYAKVDDKHYFTVKNATDAVIPTDKRIYVEGYDAFNGTIYISYKKSDNSWTAYEAMDHEKDVTNGKLYRSTVANPPPDGFTALKFKNGDSNNQKETAEISVSDGTECKYKVWGGTDGNNVSYSNSPVTTSFTYGVYTKSSSSPSGKVWMYGDNVYKQLSNSNTNPASTKLATAAIYDYNSSGLPNVYNYGPPYYVIVLYPNTNYGRLTATDTEDVITGGDIEVIVSNVLPGGVVPPAPVDVYAKDGTLRNGYQVQSEVATTVITKIISPDGTVLYQNDVASTATGNSAHNPAEGQIKVEGYTFSATKIGTGTPGSWYEKITNIPKGSIVSVRTVLASDKTFLAKSTSDVSKSFKATHYVKGYSCNGVTYDLLSYNSDGIYTSNIEIPKTISAASFEITPVYYMRDTTNTKTFIIQGFDKSVQSTGWGNTLAAYPYYIDTDKLDSAFGGYPGYPLLFYGGAYMVQIPITSDGTNTGAQIRGITLSNYFWDELHRTLAADGLNDHRQTYDYDDFVKIAKEKNPDNIILSYKYRTAKDNLKAGYHKGIDKDTGTTALRSDYVTGTGNGVEDYKDALDRKIDIFGNVLTSSDITNAGNKKILIVSDGYSVTFAGDYATEWSIFYDEDGDGSYVKEYASVAPSVLYMNNENSWNNKYTGYSDTADGKLGYYKSIYTALQAYKGIPAEITYEEEIKNDKDDVANRLDARWLYSNNSDKITANIKIEYKPLNSNTYVEDYFENPADTSSNVGNVTKTKAYFTNYTPKNIYGLTSSGEVVINPDANFTMLAEEASGYEFEGWYVQYKGADGETKVSKEGVLDGKSPIIGNATYIARFKAVQSGSLNVSHVVEQTNEYKGTGTPYIAYIIKDTSGRILEQSNGYKDSTAYNFKNSEYIKSKFNEYTIDLYLKTVPGTGSTFTEFENKNDPAFDLTDVGSEDSDAYLASETPNSTCGYGHVQFTVADVLSNPSNSNLAYVSHLRLIETSKYIYDIHYSFGSRNWGYQRYYVGIDEDHPLNEGEVAAFVIGRGADINSTPGARLSSEFLEMHRPYESNFLKKLTWNYDQATQSCSDIGTEVDHVYKITVNVTSTQDPDRMVYGEFMLPYNTIDANGTDQDTAVENNQGYVLYNPDAKTVNVSTNFLALFHADRRPVPTHFDETGALYANAANACALHERCHQKISVDDGAGGTKLVDNPDWLSSYWTNHLAPTLNLMDAEEVIYKLKAEYDAFKYEPKDTDSDYAEDAEAIANAAVEGGWASMSSEEKTALEHTLLGIHQNNEKWTNYVEYYDDYYDMTVTTRTRSYNYVIAGVNYTYQAKNYIESVKINRIKDNVDISKFDALHFYRWKIESTTKSTSAAKEVSYCYDAEFNFSGFENYTITPEYYTSDELAQHKKDDDDTSADITFLDNTRNQWNVLTTTDENNDSQTSDIIKADKLMVDFNLSFNCNGKMIKNDANVTQIGVIIQQLSELEDLATGKPVTDARYYASKLSADDDVDSIETLINGGSVNASDTINGHKTLKRVLNKSVLSTKNRVEYCYTFNNRNQVTATNGKEFTNTRDRNYVYRAFTYMVVDGKVVLSSVPAYFTLYDVATK